MDSQASSEEHPQGSFSHSIGKHEDVNNSLLLGRELFEREAPEGYIQEWSQVVSCEKKKKEVSTYCSVVIFRLGFEWLGMPTHLIREVTDSFPVHSLPHCSDDVLKGIVNIRGELQPCLSLRSLLGLKNHREDLQRPTSKGRVYRRMIVIEKNLQNWVFPVDEVQGIFHYFPEDTQNSPVTVEKSNNTLTRLVLFWQGLRVGCIDGELLTYALERKFS